MQHRSIFLLSLFLASAGITAFGRQDSLLKRTPYKLSIAVDKKTVYEEMLKEAPYVLPDKTIQLYPGETLFIEVDQTDGNIQSLKAVKEIKDSSKTVILKFVQVVEKKKHAQMMLTVVNPFRYNLVYQANIFLLNQQKWVKTNVYPVFAGISGIETWQDIIISAGLGGWAFQK